MMRKLIPVFLLVSMVLTSCNLPIAVRTPDPNEVATRVAETIAAVPTFALSTPESQPTIPELLPSATHTVESTTTPTISATATTPPGDPKISLGNPGFYDTFSSGTAFGLSSEPYQDDAVLIKVENGSMQFKSNKTNGGKRWRLTSRNPLNFYLEGTFNAVTCSGDDTYGLVFRAPTYGDGIGYYFGVTCDGYFYLQSQTESGTNTVFNWTANSNIVSGSGKVNRLGVMAKDNSIKLYINGNLVKEVIDSTISNKGYIGAYSAAYEDPDFTVQLDEISLWTLP
jgi:hypothetical protein